MREIEYLLQPRYTRVKGWRGWFRKLLGQEYEWYAGQSLFGICSIDGRLYIAKFDFPSTFQEEDLTEEMINIACDKIKRLLEKVNE